eukprot:SM000100S09454  [mRNA]  locus=s100:496110:498355:- [translate_table: standard]
MAAALAPALGGRALHAPAWPPKRLCGRAGHDAGRPYCRPGPEWRPAVRKLSTRLAAAGTGERSGATTGDALQDYYAVRRDAEAVATRLANTVASADLPSREAELLDLEMRAAQDGLWDDPAAAQALLASAADTRQAIEELRGYQAKLDEAKVAVELVAEEGAGQGGSGSAALLGEAAATLQRLAAELDRHELRALLSGPYDYRGARLTVTAGAGGTDAQDWAEMLLRMYTRWAERRGFATRVVERSPGDEAGLKSATVEVEGPYAYGYLTGEKGTHRLVRQSPFNAKGLRQTSFAGLEVMPMLDAEAEPIVTLADDDVAVQTMRAGGKGGQNVNKVETAVRIVHLPTGIAVKCSEERSQSMNKSKALALLQARLAAIAAEQRAAEVAAIRGDVVKAEWGRQTRNYVLHPYKLAKDAWAGGFETPDVAAVLDGDLDRFIAAALRQRAAAAAAEATASTLALNA